MVQSAEAGIHADVPAFFKLDALKSMMITYFLKGYLKSRLNLQEAF